MSSYYDKYRAMYFRMTPGTDFLKSFFLSFTGGESFLLFNTDWANSFNEPDFLILSSPLKSVFARR